MLPLRPTPQPTNREEQGCEVPRLHRERRSASYRVFSEICSFLSLSHLWCARLFRSGQEWRTPIPRPDLARFGPIHSQWRGSRWGRCGLVRPACTRERGPESLRWPWLASSRVARRGKLLFRLHLVAFRCISHRHRLLGKGAGDARFPPARERRGPSRG